MEEILIEVRKERQRQDDKWGVQNHHPFIWLSILAEEVGEANTAVLEAEFDGQSLDHYRGELVQVAASAIAAIECLDGHRSSTG